ncbi:MAG: hypothetical protein ACE5GZ_14360 [Gammaproteobacteria bacterium]
MRFVLAFLCFTSLGAVQAQDLFQNDFNSLLYVKVTFDGKHSSDRDDSMKLGFTINHSSAVVERLGGMNLMSPHSLHRPLVDVEFSSKTRYFSKFKIGGVDTLIYRTVMNADGSSESITSKLSIKHLVAAVMVAGIAYGIAASVNNDDNDKTMQSSSSSSTSPGL